VGRRRGAEPVLDVSRPPPCSRQIRFAVEDRARPLSGLRHAWRVRPDHTNPVWTRAVSGGARTQRSKVVRRRQSHELRRIRRTRGGVGFPQTTGRGRMSGSVRRWIVRLVRAVLVAYVIGLAILFALQRQVLFPAGKDPPARAGAGLVGLMEPAKTTTADDLALLSWYHSPPTRDAPLVVLFHGNGGTIEIRA